ncbi:MAG TPA: UbiD family decarboxylase, partial [Chloroflexota bacterium]|nr:UbiD family decarboxylase [Chloroflexota bacterium]
MAKDLRTYLSTLIERYPEQLKVVEKEVQPEFEAAAIVDKMENDPRYPNFPAVLFKKIKGSDMPLILNLHGTYERLALACGAELRTLVADYARLEGTPIPSTRVSSDAAPVHEVVLRDEQIDLTTLLPLLLHNELDAGKYITSAACIVRDPNTGRQNMGIFRHQLQGQRQLGFMTNPAHDTSYVLRQLREEGKPLEVALAIGHHPAMLMGAVSQLPGIGGELEVAGSLMGESMQVVQCKTVDLEVPARAEIVIEGIVDTDPEKMQHEGPFGEYPRYYTG